MLWATARHLAPLLVLSRFMASTPQRRTATISVIVSCDCFMGCKLVRKAAGCTIGYGHRIRSRIQKQVRTQVRQHGPLNFSNLLFLLIDAESCHHLYPSE